MLSAWVVSCELGMRWPRLGHQPRQPDVVGDHRAIAGGADLLQRQPHLQRAEAARVLRAVVDVVRGVLVEVVVGRVVGERGAQRAPDRAPARSRLRAARRATCAGSTATESARLSAAQVVGRLGRPRPRSRRRRRPRGTRRRAPGTARAISGSGSTAPVLTEPAVPTTRHGTSPAATSASSCRRSAATSIRSCCVGRDPADRRRCRARPGRRPSESTCASRPSRRRAAGGRRRPPRRARARPSRPCAGPRGQEADDVGHVAAAHEQAAAVRRVADELGDPAHRLRFDLGRGRRQRPGADVRVHRRREQIAEHADRRRRRRDVAEEARMPVEQRVLEQQLRRLLEQRPRVDARLPAAGPSGRAPRARPRATRRASRAARHRFEEGRHLVHEPMPERAKRRGVHRQCGRRVGCLSFIIGIPSNRSVSRRARR